MNERDVIMKQFLKKLTLILLAFSLCLGPVSAGTDMVQVSAKEAVKNGWKKEAAGYCYYQNGKKLTNQWLKGKYYLGADGARKTGWYTIKNKSYYFDSKGVVKSSKTKSIDANLVKKMDKTIKAAGVKDSTGKSTALKLLFNYLSDKTANGGSGNYGYLIRSASLSMRPMRRRCSPERRAAATTMRRLMRFWQRGLPGIRSASATARPRRLKPAGSITAG